MIIPDRIITWMYIIVYELSVLDRNTWNNSTVCKLVICIRSEYHICIKQANCTKNLNINAQWI